MSNEYYQEKIKDLVFVTEDGSIPSKALVSNIEGYRINGKPIDNMHGAQSLNLIVGANNSGKSRFVRGLLRQNFRLIPSETWDDFNRLNTELKTLLEPAYGRDGLLSSINVTNLNENFFLIDEIKTDYPTISEEDRVRANVILKKLKCINYNKLNKSIYIPALRTAHTLYDKDDKTLIFDFYSNTLKKNYPEIKSIEGSPASTKSPEIEIFTGINLYEEIRKTRNNIREVRKKFEEFELFLSTNFFDGKEVDVIAIDEDDTRRINIHIEGKEKNKDIHELGDGIQAIIILMYKIFMAEANTLIVIDEPELHLHPGFQRIFMQATLKLLEERNNNNIIFIVTHSNHLMDLTLTQEDVSIYSFSKSDEDSDYFSIRACKAGDYSLLSELGVNSSSAFIANTSIWVEGPTDRKYLNFFLRKHIEKVKPELSIKEDIDYAFYEYGGSLLAHYDFNTSDEENKELVDKIKAFALANRIFLLADKDSTSLDGKDEKSKRLSILEGIAEDADNFSFNKTEGVEIENILPSKVYKSFIHQLYTGSPSDTVKSNIEDSIDNYKDKSIGSFLHEVLNTRQGIKVIRKFKASTGTLEARYKKLLCDDVCNSYFDVSYDNLVSENSSLDILIKNLFEFISAR